MSAAIQRAEAAGDALSLAFNDLHWAIMTAPRDQAPGPDFQSRLRGAIAKLDEAKQHLIEADKLSVG